MRHGVQAMSRVGKAVFVLFLCLVAYCFYAYQKLEVRTHYKPIKAARNNPYYASIHWLQNHGKEAVFWQLYEGDDKLNQILDDPKPTGKTLFLQSSPNQSPKPLLGWVRQGGQLVLYADNPMLQSIGIHFEDMDIVAKPLGLVSYAKPILLDNQVLVIGAFLDKINASTFVREQGASLVNHSALHSQMHPDDITKMLGIDPKQAQAMADFLKQNRTFYDGQSALLEAKLGKGRLVVLEDETLFFNPSPSSNNKPEAPNEAKAQQNNNRLWHLLQDEAKAELYEGGLANFDHAQLLLWLTKDSQKVYFVDSLEYRSLFGVITQRTPFLWVALVLVLLALLFGQARQFGATKEPKDDSAYDFLLYFSKVGDYLWRVDTCQSQVAQNRQALIQKIQAKLGQLPAHPEECCAYLDRHTGLSAKTFYDALYQSYDNEEQFFRITCAFDKVQHLF